MNSPKKIQPQAERPVRHEDGDNNVDAELYDPLEASSERDLRRAMPGVIRRAHLDAERRS